MDLLDILLDSSNQPEHYLDPAFMSYFPDETLLPHIEEVAESSPYDSSNYSLVSDTIH